ncbi:endonuclease/exonuclease/phosphatase family protein [Nostocoides australiense]
MGGPNDAFGFGFFPGQYGMVVYSKYPIDQAAVRTFQHFLWKDMPGALLPDDPATPAPRDWYSAAEVEQVRLSSKSHWDVPIQVGGRTVHFLVSHPTPPVFDGPEDRTATEPATTTRSGSGPTMCAMRTTCTTMRGNAADSAPARRSSSPATRTPTGNLRVDYVLPSKQLRIKDSEVFWPVSSDPLSALTGTYPFLSSDHRLVWADVLVRGKGR